MAGERTVKISIIGEDKFSPALRNAGQETGALEVNLSGLGGALGKASGLAIGFGAALGAAGIGLALKALEGVGAAVSAVTSHIGESQAATGKFQAQLGLTREEAERLGGVAQKVWANNWGESVGDVTQSIATLRQNLGDMSDESTGQLTEMALILRDTFGAGVDETTRTVGVLTKTFEGLSEAAAFDLITTGFQNGLDFSGEMLDTLREYAPQFEAMGFSADQFMAILIEGAKAGAFNLDKVGDAMKEFNIRAKDGSTTTADAFKALGLNAKQLSADFAAGGERGTAAFASTAAALASIEDPLKRNQIGVALFGATWEDLEADVVGAMANGVKGLKGFEGATDKAGKALGENLGAQWQTLQRMIIAGVSGPLGKALGKFTEFFTANMPRITAAVNGAIGVFQRFASYVGGAISAVVDAFGKLRSGEITLAQFIGGIKTMIATIAGDLFGGVGGAGIGNFVGTIVGALRTAMPIILNELAILGRAFGNWVTETALPWLMPRLWALLQWIGTWLTGTAIPWAVQALTALGQAFGNWVTTTAIPFLQTNLPIWLSALGTWITGTALPAITGWIGAIASAFGTWVSESAIPYLQENLPVWLLALGNWILDTALPAIGEFLVTVGQAFGTWVSETAVPYLQENIPLWLSALSDWYFNTAAPAIREFLIDAGKKFGTWITETAVPYLQQHIPEWLAAMSAWITGTALPAIGEFLITIGKKFGTFVTETAIPYLREHIPQWLAALGDFLTNTALPAIRDKAKEIGLALVDKFMEEAGKLIGKVKTKMGEVPGAIQDGIGDLTSLLYQKGLDLVQGLIDGMNALLQSVRNKAAEIARAAADAVAGALGIRSPSTVMRGIGVNVVKGMIVGIGETLPALSASVNNGLAAIFGGAAKNVIPEVAKVAASVNAGLAAIFGKSEVTKVAASVNAGLAAIFGGAATAVTPEVAKVAASVNAGLAAIFGQSQVAKVAASVNAGLAAIFGGAAKAVAPDVAKLAASVNAGLGAIFGGGTSDEKRLGLPGPDVPQATAFTALNEQVVGILTLGLQVWEKLKPYLEIPRTILGAMQEEMVGVLGIGEQLFEQATALKETAAYYANAMKDAFRLFTEGQSFGNGISSLGVQTWDFSTAGAAGGGGGGTVNNNTYIQAPVYGVNHFDELLRAADQRNGRRGG